ncbi:MAG: type II toxin-antitoxin system VapC family toxin [Verrucomicrobia bacterium]|nr:type II toxin-antitoxin system VapC family toxin [Verrucomicrobiota bacterium]
MTGLDTNILVRYFTRDDPKQWKLVNTFLESNCDSKNSGWISSIVLCEVVWVLSTGYEYSKSQIITLLNQLLLTAELRMEAHDTVRQVIKDYETGNADFSDYLIGRLNQKTGCETTITFDKKVAAHLSFTLLK